MQHTLLLSLPAPQIWRKHFVIFMLAVLGGFFISFQAAAIPLEIVSKSPASGSFPSGGRELSITLNKSVGLTLQPSKELRVYRYSDDALLQTLDISHDNTNQVGDDIYFTLDEFLPHGVEVYVQIDYGIYTDYSADPDDHTPAISDDSWRFTVGSDRPEITNMSVISDNLAPVNLQLEITFDRSVVKSDEDGIEFGVYRKSDDFRVNGFNVVDVDGSTVTISSSSSYYTNLQSNTEYYVSMEDGYFVQYNSAVRAAEGVGQSNQYEWSFTTRVNDGNAPDLVSLSPANGEQRAPRLAEDLEFTMTFDEPVYLGNTSSKALLYRASDDMLIYNLGANSSSSEDNLSVTFTTPNNLTTDTEYYILLDITSGALGLPYYDTDENSIPAISNSNQWAFKTYGSIQKTAYSPEIAAEDASANLVATLTTDASLSWGDAGDINLVNYIGSSVEKTIANGSGDVSFDGTSVTIDFGEVDYETHFYISFDNGAIVDEFDQSVTFTNKQWHFTTEVAPNVAPTNIELTSYDVNENSAVNTVVGFLFATDENAGDSHIYSLVSNPGNLFNISGYNLRVNGDLDFEASATHVIRVEADDQNGGTFEKDLTITVNNVVESPTDILLSSTSIDENNEEDALIGTLSTEDSDIGETHIYSLNINPGGAFYISNGNELRTNFVFDYEDTESYDIRILTEDQNGGEFFKDFTITVNDIVENVAPTDISLTFTSIDENSPDDAAIAGISATDADVGDTHIYTLLVNPDNSFSISGSLLYANASFDYEAQSSYEIRIQAEDQGDNTFEKDFTITINDVNENPTDISLSVSAIDENNNVNDVIGTLSTTDVDDANTHTYSLVTNPGSSFNINNNELRASESFDFETQATYDIRIEAEDQDGGVFEKDFTISINDVVNENSVPTDITLSPSDLNENAFMNSIVGSFTATDADGGDSHTFSLVAGDGSTDNGSFFISGDDLRVGPDPDFDYETKDTYFIRVRANDGNGGLFEEELTITINDVNEAPTDVSLSATSIDENNAIDAVIGVLSTTDEDDSDIHTYTLVGGAGGEDNSSFNIDGANLRASEIFDFETKDSYNVKVRSNDNNGGTYDESFVISINDVAENQSPTAVNLTPANIDENKSVGAIIGTLTSVDADAGDSHTYSLQNFLATFTIEGDQLKADIAFDYEDQDSYTVDIQTNDGNGGLFTESVTITINDINEDVAGPSVVSFNPADGATGVALDADLVVTFDEPILAGPGDIQVRDVNNGNTYILGDTQQGLDVFSIDGNELTIHMGGEDKNRNFDKAKEYYVTIRSGAVSDLTDNDFEGWDASNKTEWNFETEKYDPSFTFNLTDKLSSADPFTVFASSNSSGTKSYTVLSGPATLDGNQMTLTGELGTVTVRADLEESATFKSATVTSAFEVTDGVSPSLVSLSPVTNATGVALDGNLIATFDEPIQAGAGQVWIKRDVGNGIAQNASFATTPELLSIDGNDLVFDLSNLAEGTLEPGASYYALIFDDAVQDLAGNEFADGFAANDKASWFFTMEKRTPTISLNPIANKVTEDDDFMVSATSDNEQVSIVYSIVSGPATISGQTISLTGAIGTVTVQASQVETAGFVAESVTTTFDVSDTPDMDGPQIVSFTPEDGAVEVPKGSDLAVTFNEPIQFGNGFIQVIRGGGSGQQVISAAGNSGQDVFSIDGSVLTIHLGGEDRIRDLFFGAEYYVNINTSAIRDLSGNNLETGISNTTDWNFTAEREKVTWSGGAWSNGTGPSFNKDAIIDDDLSVVDADAAGGSFNLTAFDLTINAGNTLTVDGDRSLIVYGDIVNNGSVVVESGSSLTTYEGSSVIGNGITIQRNTRYADGKYSFVGTPVEEDASITGADLGSHVYRYDEGASADENDLVRWQDASLDALVPGRGYTQANQQLIEFVGKPNNGTITYGGSHSTDGWQLVSNPYPAAIHIDDFIDGNEDITGSVYIWDDNGSDVSRGLNSDYIVATKMGATDSHGVDSEARFNDHIGSMQGFFVQLDGFSGLVNFTEEMRVSGQNEDDNFFRQVDMDEVSRIRVNLTNEEGLFRQAMIGWGSAFSDTDFIKGYDAELFRSGSYQIYSMKEDLPLSIQAASAEREQVALGMKIEKSGLYSLEIDTREYSGEEVFIHDLIAGRYISAADGPYQFMANGGQLTNRFELVVKSAVLGVHSNLAEVYASGKTLYIKTKDDLVRDYQVFNLLGVEVMTIRASGSSEVDLNDLSNGVYIVSDGIESKKVILK